MRKEYRLRSKRLASFREYSITVSSARSKKTKIVNAAWPHPPTSKLTPESLADAGFFFNPDDDAPDKTECFICGLSLANWEEDDEPRTEHLKRSNSCTWTEARWSLRGDRVKQGKLTVWRFNSDDRVPTHPARIKARLETFASWPHDKKKGHNCTSEALAQAGFVHVPDVGDGEDMVVCDYCNRSLNGWEPDDIPIEEHRRNNTTMCPFLEAYDREQILLEQGGTGDKHKSTKHKRTASKSVRKRASASASDSENAPDAVSYSKAKSRRRQPSAQPISASSPSEVAFEGDLQEKPKRKPKKTISKTKTSKTREQLTTGSENAVSEEENPVSQARTRSKRGKGRTTKFQSSNSQDSLNLLSSNVESQAGQLSSDDEVYRSRRSQRIRQSQAKPSLATHSRIASPSRNPINIGSHSLDDKSPSGDDTPVKRPLRSTRSAKQARDSNARAPRSGPDEILPSEASRRLGRSVSTRGLSSTRQLGVEGPSQEGPQTRTRTRTSSKRRTSTSSRTRAHSRTTSMQSLEEYDTGITTDVTGTESLVDDEDITYTKDATRPKRVSRKPSSIRKGSTVNAVDMDAASDTSVVNESTPLASRSNKIVGGQTIPAPQLSRPTPRTRSVSSSSLAQPGAGGTVTVEIDVLDHISRVMEAVHPAKPKRPIVALPKRTSQQPSPLSQPQPATRTPHQQNPTPTSPAKPPKSPPTSTGHYDPSLVIPRVKSKSSGSRIDTGTVAEFSSKLESNDSQAGTESHTETQIQDSSLIGRGAHSPTPRKGNPHHSDGHPPNAEPTVEVQTQDVSEPQSTTLVHPSSSFSSDGFTEEQLDMTIQQFIEAETQRVYQNMKRSGEQLIEELVEEGKRQRAIIVAHLNASSIPE